MRFRIANSVLAFFVLLACSFSRDVVADVYDEEVATVYFRGFGPTVYNQQGSVQLSILEDLMGSNPSDPGRYWRISGATGTNEISTPWVDARLQVGKKYNVHALLVNIAGSIPPMIGAYFKCPTGYQIEFEGAEWGGGNGQYAAFYITGGVYSIRVVRSDVGPPLGRAGESSILSNGKFDWEFYLGSQDGGESAGKVTLRDFTFHDNSPNPPNTSGLDPWELGYSPKALALDNGDAYYSPGNAASPKQPGALEQIMRPQAFVNIRSNSLTDYEIEFYDPAVVSGNDYPYIIPSGANPFIVYHVEKPSGSSNTDKTLKITKKIYEGTVLKRSELTSINREGTWPNYEWTVDDWHDVNGSALARDYRVSSKLTNIAVTDDHTKETYTLTNPSDGTEPTSLEGYREFRAYEWGEEIIKEHVGPTNSSLSTDYEYYTDSSNIESYTKAKSIKFPGGGWKSYVYQASGATGFPNGGHVIRTPYLDAPASPTYSGTSGVVTTYKFAPSGTQSQKYESIEKKINNVLVERSTFDHDSIGVANGLGVWREIREDWASASLEQTTTTRSYSEAMSDSMFRGNPLSVEKPDGTKTAYVYQRGSWNAGTSTFTAGSGTATRIGTIQGTIITTGSTSQTSYAGYSLTVSSDSTDTFRLVANRSTMAMVIRDEDDRLVRSEQSVWNGSAWELMTYEKFEYNVFGRMTKRWKEGQLVYTAEYVGDLLVSETDEWGTKTTIATTDYDAAGRAKKVKRLASGQNPEQTPEVATVFEYNAGGKVTSSEIYDALNPIVSTSTFDTAGRIASSTSPEGGTTVFTYDPANRKNTISYPDTKTRIEERHRDGRTKSVTGTGVVNEYYSYSVESGSDGRRKTKVTLGTSTSARIRESWRDWLGRMVKTSMPGLSTGPNHQPAYIEETVYDSKGQVAKTTASGYADTLYEYDAMGSLVRSGLDVGTAGLVLASKDRISRGSTEYKKISGDWWLESKTIGYLKDNRADATTLSTTKLRIGGLTNTLRAETVVHDVEGNSMTVKTERDASYLTNKKVTVTKVSTGIAGSSKSTLVNGLQVSVEDLDGRKIETYYDSLGRVLKTDDSRIGDTSFEYVAGTSLVNKVINPDSSESLSTYDNMGRLVSYTDPLANKTFTSYTDLGLQFRQWGDGIDPVEYAYDEFGVLKKISTWRNGGAAWDSSTWPSSLPSGRADTQFAYDEASGLQYHRKYADGNAVVTFYDVARRLTYRSWIRRREAPGAPSFPDPDSAVVTEWTFDSETGDLLAVSYNDADENVSPTGISVDTPKVTYAYDRAGRVVEVDEKYDHANLPINTRTFQYSATHPWRLDYENLGPYYGNRRLKYSYESGGVVGREAGFQLGTSTDHDAVLKQNWSYDTAGRLASVAAYDENATTARTFSYSYLANTRMVSTIQSGSYWQKKNYDSDANRVSSIETRWGSVFNSAPVKARFEYDYNNRGQRKWKKQSGENFSNDGSPVTYSYGYDDVGQVTYARAYRGTESDIGNSSKRMPHLQFSYAYDDIGNTVSSARETNGLFMETATFNSLNSLLTRENKAVYVSGVTGTPTSVVALADNGVVGSAARQGEYWSASLALPNSSHPDYLDLTAYASYANSVEQDSRFLEVGASLQTHSYDADGNLLGDGIWELSYDAMNRLVHAKTNSLARSLGFPKTDVYYSYDYIGRRVQKRVTDNGTEILSRRYVYNGWNLIAEFDAPGGSSIGNLERTYAWGLGAMGGVGGLLQIADHRGTGVGDYLPAYDANGNVMALYNAANGVTAAVYDYSPFGELIRSEGSYAEENSIRFSSNYSDDETGLVYYGYRYYSPKLGRFITRDPIRESGGLNLYRFANNDPVNGIDVLGLTGEDDLLLAELDPFEVRPDFFTTALNLDQLAGFGIGVSGIGFEKREYELRIQRALLEANEARIKSEIEENTKKLAASYSKMIVVLEAEKLVNDQEGAEAIELEPFVVKANYVDPGYRAFLLRQRALREELARRDYPSTAAEYLSLTPGQQREMRCMGCHGMDSRERGLVGLPSQQAWFNREGTTNATRNYFVTVAAGEVVLVSGGVIATIYAAEVGTGVIATGALSQTAYASNFAFTANASLGAAAESAVLATSARITVQWGARIAIADTAFGGLEGLATGQGPTGHLTGSARDFFPNNPFRDAAQAGGAGTHQIVEWLLNMQNGGGDPDE